MTTAEGGPPPGPPAGSRIDATTPAGQVRGSTVLLVGRFIAIGIDLVTQVLIVRYLTKADFGAFAFGLAIVSLASSAAVIGLDKTIPRFVPFYEERGDRGTLMGAILLAVVAILGVGIAIVLLITGLGGGVGGEIVENEQALSLLLILIVLAPISALDSLLLGLLSVFAGPRAIFVRRYLMAPGLQLLVVLILTTTGSSVLLLGTGYVVAGALGVLVFGALLVRILGERGLLRDIRRALRFPIREIFGFALPLMSSDLVVVLRSSLAVLLLQLIATSVEVADYRAVLPLARQNLLVFSVFSVLYLPAASRLIARGVQHEVGELYWRTATWIAVMTFPVFAVSFALAEPLTVLLYGEPYRSSAPLLAVLALGHYTSAVLGFNALTLRAYGRVRYIVTMDIVTVVVGVLALVTLIGSLGALGAAIATSATLILQNVLYQIGLARERDIGAFDPHRLVTYATIALLAAALVSIQLLLEPPLLVGLAIAAGFSLVLLALKRDALRIGETFPELARVPGLRRLIGSPPA